MCQQSISRSAKKKCYSNRRLYDLAEIDIVNPLYETKNAYHSARDTKMLLYWKIWIFTMTNEVINNFYLSILKDIDFSLDKKLIGNFGIEINLYG